MSLAQSFAKGSRRLKWHATTVHSVIRLDVSPGDRIKITRIMASDVRAQAVKLALDRGELSANGLVVPRVAVWSHTAPSEVEIEVVGRRAKSLDLWNAWSFKGVEASWLNNSAMVLEELDGGHILRCSDGVGEVNFDDLVVRIDIASDT